MCRSIRPAIVTCLLAISAGAAAEQQSTSTDVAGATPVERAVDQAARGTPAGVATVQTADSSFAVDGTVATDADDAPSADAVAAVAPAVEHAADPLQRFNRRTFAFNEFADRVVLRPVASTYRAVMPELAQRGVHNALENLGQPVVAVNQLLQGKLDLAVNDAGRFLLNTTVGLVGLIDVAAQLGLPAHNEDFGQTLGVWGVPQGPFLMLPLLGPSSPTTVAGSVLDMMFKPTTWMDATTARYTIAAVGVVDTRAQLLEADALVTGDRYSFIRDAYVQRRIYLQADGVVDDPFLDDAEDE